MYAINFSDEKVVVSNDFASVTISLPNRTAECEFVLGFMPKKVTIDSEVIDIDTLFDQLVYGEPIQTAQTGPYSNAKEENI